MKTKLTVLLSLILVLRASAGVLPPDAVVDGRTIGEWSAEWWKWAFSCPTNQNPLIDTNGVNAHNCQPGGPVFFLAGSFLISRTVIRTITVPEGKHLFFPMLNVYAGDPADCPTIECRRDAAAAFITNHTELHASIDGVAVGHLGEHRAQSPVFSFEFPSCDNIMTINNGFCISGLVDNMVSDGYWLMLAPLPAGQHTVNIGGTLGSPFHFTLDTTYHITVVPDPNQYVLPPDAVVDGKTIGEWSAEWWKWVFSIPTHQNPQLDTDGRWANIGQPDADVFFLGGHSGLTPDTMTRSFTVPEGKFLLVPVLVAQNDNIDVIPPAPISEMIDLLVEFLNDPRDLRATIDGVHVPNLREHRALSPVFSFEFTKPDNFKSFNQGHPITGLVDPIISDGYWLMLQPLPVGSHVLHYGGAFQLPFFSTNDVIAHITVVPVSLDQKVEELLAKVEAANIPAKRKRALETTLLRAGAAFEKGKVRAGINHLRAFQHQVRAQRSRFNPDLAQDFISQAQAIIDRAREDLPKGKRGDDDDDDDGDDDDD